MYVFGLERRGWRVDERIDFRLYCVLDAVV